MSIRTGYDKHPRGPGLREKLADPEGYTRTPHTAARWLCATCPDHTGRHRSDPRAPDAFESIGAFARIDSRSIGMWTGAGGGVPSLVEAP